MRPREIVIATSVALGTAACTTATPAPSATDTVASGAQRVDVTLTSDGCTPTQVTVRPGLVAFVASNASRDPASFAVVAADRAVGQLERIPSGRTGMLSLALEAGSYRAACRAGSTSGGGSIEVGEATGDAGVGPAPDMVAAIGAYRDALTGAAAAAVAAAEQLRRACEVGDLAAARHADTDLRRTYRRLVSVARDFSAGPVTGRTDLDAAIVPPADAASSNVALGTTHRAGNTAPSGGSGLPAIEEALWAEGATAGVAPIAAQVEQDLVLLQGRISAVPIDITAMATDLARVVGSAAAGLSDASGSTAPTAVAEAGGAVDAAAGFLEAFGDALRRRDPTSGTRVAGAVEAAQAALATLATARDRAPDADPAGLAARRDLASALDALADAIADAPLFLPATS